MTITSLPNPANLAPQELQALIKYIQLNKDTDSDWFTIQPKAGGQSWAGKCWYVVGSGNQESYWRICGSGNSFPWFSKAKGRTWR